MALSCFSRSVARGSSHRRSLASPGFETLEDRILLDAGDLDPTFGVGDQVLTDFGSLIDEARDVVVQDDGKIVVVGRTAGPRGGDFALARYNSDGTLDTTFGMGGKVISHFGGRNDEATRVTIDIDGPACRCGSSARTTSAIDAA